jgi:hypothetical protein
VAVKEPPKKTLSALARLSAAQISRTARKAVHSSLQNPVGGLEDACLIVNSLWISSVRNDPLRSSQLDPGYATNIIDFGRDVSPRLSSHALLHGLLRIGHVHQASGLATMMLETGMRLRSKTVEAVLHATLPPPPKSNLPRPTIPAQPFNLLLDQSKLSNLTSMTENESTRAALQLLGAARDTRGGRTHGMFGTLLAICLINGEIILGSLIFGFLVKDWGLKKSLSVRFHEASDTESDKPPAKIQFNRPRYHVLPTPAWLKQILSPIDDTLSGDGDDEAFRLSLASALQALAYLAVLLDHRRLPFAGVAPLIRSLYNCPRVDDEVWIVNREGHLQRVKAYPYFHGVLQRLVENLPERKDRQRQMLHELDINSLNSLLHYTLRHRRSPAHAEIILQHMKERRTPLNPDIATYNILLRSGTILRQNNILRKALEALHLRFGPNESRVWQQASNSRVTQGYQVVSERSPPPPDPHALSLQEGVMPSSTPEIRLEPNLHTISSYITHLSSTGQSQHVVELVFELFPEIHKADLTALSHGDVIKKRRRARAACIMRAAKLGPYVLTALLSALFNAGKTGLVKWLWNLTRSAERKSWKANPWFIPIHAYTIRIQCCSLEHRMLSTILASRRPTSSPQKKRKYMLYVGGALYRSMKHRARSAQAAITAGTLPTNVAIPLPDLRFFNAVLALFMQHGRRRRSKAHFRSNFRRARRQHAITGRVSHHWDPLLQEVGEDMIRAGYAIPPGLRHIFIGHWDAGTWNLKRPLELDRRPFAYPSSRLPYSPYRISVRRCRGLYPRKKRRWTKNLDSILNG